MTRDLRRGDTATVTGVVRMVVHAGDGHTRVILDVPDDPTPRENRPTLTPEPNRPTETLDDAERPSP